MTVAFITRGKLIAVFKIEIILSIYWIENINKKEALIAERLSLKIEFHGADSRLLPQDCMQMTAGSSE